nr:Coenzyme F420 hydrogenase/dehydrogenase, beta subunit C-terminal domain [Prevotella lacticifex]
MYQLCSETKDLKEFCSEYGVNYKSHSDLTLADFWSINTINPSFDDDKGCSLVLINSGRGNATFESLKLGNQI